MFDIPIGLSCLPHGPNEIFSFRLGKSKRLESKPDAAVQGVSNVGQGLNVVRQVVTALQHGVGELKITGQQGFQLRWPGK